jgi:hypothetical protein
MNKWRDSCLRGQDSLRSKVEKFEKDITIIKQNQPSISSSSSLPLDDSATKELYKKLESAVSEKEPLIISILSTVFEDLKEIHRKLGVFCSIDPKPEEIKQA